MSSGETAPNHLIQDAIRDRAIVEQLLAWFSTNRRNFPWRCGELDDWQVIVTEMLLQQTGAERVAEFLYGFFAEFPTLGALLNTEEETLANRLVPLGLHRRRAKRIREFAAIAEGLVSLPTTRGDLESIPGVGPYIAAAYLSIVHGQALATVDVNMARLVERLYGPRKLVDIRRDPHINDTAARLLKLAADPREFNWAILDLAWAHCRARQPACTTCPLLQHCPSGAKNVTS